MANKTPTAGPFSPETQLPMRISMAGDDCSLHFDLDNLTPKQAQDHLSNQVLTGMLQVALLYIAKPEDEVSLYDTFLEPQWQNALLNYHQMFSDMGLAPTPWSQVRYHDVESFYPSTASEPSSCTLENLYMISGSNFPLHQSSSMLNVSRKVNSKFHFAQHAPSAGIDVPATLCTTKQALTNATTQQFISQHGLPMMLKTNGLAGARNVTVIESLQQAEEYLAEYPADFEVILQAKLNSDEYIEMTVDLNVSRQHIEVTNVRQILFAQGLWVGNLMGKTVTLTAHHEQQLLKVGEYARSHGYCPDQADLAYNLGIDYFIRADHAADHLPELLVTEINARWTGGLFPAQLVKRLQVDHLDIVAFIDMCPPQHFAAYIKFLQDHLYQPSDPKPWSIAPMGFAPFPTPMQDADGNAEEILFVWQIVIGDFEAFKHAVHNAFPEDLSPDSSTNPSTNLTTHKGVLPTVPLISTGL